MQQKIKEKFETLPQELKLVIRPFNGFQNAISFLPAVLAARFLESDDDEWLGRTVNIFKLDQLKDFDQQWFASAFQTISGWMYFQGQEKRQ
jgi:hypothetical protein